MLEPKNRTHVTDAYFDSDESDSTLRDSVFHRVSAKKKTFQTVDFRYSTFEGCYFRACTFDSCDFTGCRFVDTSFHGSTFTGCKFDYASFERTLIDSHVLERCCPQSENIQYRFARTLRTNYQSLGDTDSANKAILVEINATRNHLYKAWKSPESYYRKKYAGVQRGLYFLKWFRFSSPRLKSVS